MLEINFPKLQVSDTGPECNLQINLKMELQSQVLSLHCDCNPFVLVSDYTSYREPQTTHPTLPLLRLVSKFSMWQTPQMPQIRTDATNCHRCHRSPQMPQVQQYNNIFSQPFQRENFSSGGTTFQVVEQA